MIKSSMETKKVILISTYDIDKAHKLELRRMFGNIKIKRFSPLDFTIEEIIFKVGYNYDVFVVNDISFSAIKKLMNPLTGKKTVLRPIAAKSIDKDGKVRKFLWENLDWNGNEMSVCFRV